MKDVTHEELEALKRNNQKMVIDYWAEWCGPCKVLIPTLESIENDFDDVLFVKVNVDQNIEHAKSIGIRSVPTLIYLKNNEEVSRTSGAIPAQKIKEMINDM